jgi:hypothetical protein
MPFAIYLPTIEYSLGFSNFSIKQKRSMNKRLSWFNLLGFGFICFVLSSFLEPTEMITPANLLQRVKPVNLKGEYAFAGEKIPLDNFDVKERLDRELNVNAYWQSSTILNIKNAAKYFPTIETILKEQGIPDDFKYLAVAESALRNAASPSGARGFWQFLSGTAREMGLEVNRDIDERYNLELATVQACKYIKKNYSRFGSWTLSAAAYNTGPTRLSNEMTSQGESSYYDLNLSEETMRYVFRIVALKEIMNQPEEYGFIVDSNDIYTPLNDYYKLLVDYQIDDLAKFAHENGTTYRMLKVYNPWMRTNKLPNKSKKKYLVKIPKQL